MLPNIHSLIILRYKSIKMKKTTYKMPKYLSVFFAETWHAFAESTSKNTDPYCTQRFSSHFTVNTHELYVQNNRGFSVQSGGV